jgi:thioredoxin-like negative regulator of GroEL
MFEKLTQFNLHHRVAEQATPTLVFFTAPACASCRHLKAVLQLVASRQPDWRIFEVNAQQESGLVNEFEVFHLPSMFLFSAGDYHAELSCEANPAAIETAIEAALHQPRMEAP